MLTLDIIKWWGIDAKQLYTNRHLTFSFTKITSFHKETKQSNYLASNWQRCWQTCSGKGATEMLTACEVDGGCGSRWYSSSVMKGMKGESNRKPQSSTRYNVSLAEDTACVSPLVNTGFRHSCLVYHHRRNISQTILSRH